jgi:hypothetical protein
MGRFANLFCFLILRVASYPSISGIMMSMRTKSICNSSARYAGVNCGEENIAG